MIVVDLSRLLADGGHADRRGDGRVAAVVERHGGVHPGRPVLRAGVPESSARRRGVIPARRASWRRRAAPGCGGGSRSWSVPAQFHDFGGGVVPLSGFFYFLALAAAMLYLNMVLLGRRHWAGGEASEGLWLHAAVRFAAVLLALFSLIVLVGRMGAAPTPARRAAHALGRVADADRSDPGRPPGHDPGVSTARRSRASTSRPRPTC